MAEPISPKEASAAPGPVAEAPFRSELLSAERLADEARGIAAAQRWTTLSPPRTTPLIALTDRAAQSLAADNRELAQSALAGFAASPAGEWLLDNYYLIEEQVLLIREDLPARYGVELPRLEAGPYAGFPRIYEALLSLIAHTDSRIDESLLVEFVDGYQDVDALTIGEAWAVPIMLRIGLVENLRRLSSVVTATQRAEQDADAWTERLIITTQDAPEHLGELIEELDRDSAGASNAFYLRLAQRLSAVEGGGEAINAWLERRLATAGVALHRAQVELQQAQASNQVSIANSITSIRFLDAYEWREFFERVSLVERELQRDPSQTYPAMDYVSRDRYRHALEQMARRCDHTEIQLAEKVVILAREALAIDPTDEVCGHVGWWLVGAGRIDLEREVDYVPTNRERVYRGPLRHGGLYYWGLHLLISALLLLGLGYYALGHGATAWGVALLVLLGVVPLSEVSLAIVNRLSAFVFPPRTLPKLDFRQPVADAHRTFVVVPALLSSVKATRHIIENIEVAYLANRDANVAFGLLGDLKGADSQILEADGAIVEAAIRGISELNDRYETEHGVRPFHLLVRERTYNASARTWMGWERKRGALVELVREMRGETETSFVTKLGDAQFRHSSAFVITLDADTILPRDGARRLISTIAHPLNRARFSPGDARVGVGYGLIQPRVGMSLEGARRSRFADLYSGVTGIDPYAGAVSDTYQDVFGEGSFTGKGIFEVDLFRALLDDRFPDNTLLSHDLIEGSFLRTALASDIEVLDDYPANYLAAAARMHRWIRGDWQILPFLGGAVERPDGTFEHNPLNALSRWKIFDNLRRALVPPATLLLFTVGWMVLSQPSLSWPLILLLVILFPAYFSLADSMVFRPRTVSFSSYAPDVVRDFGDDSERGRAVAVRSALSRLDEHGCVGARRLATDGLRQAPARMGDCRRRRETRRVHATVLLEGDGGARAARRVVARGRRHRHADETSRWPAAGGAVARGPDLGVAPVPAHAGQSSLPSSPRTSGSNYGGSRARPGASSTPSSSPRPSPRPRQLPRRPRRCGGVADLAHQHGTAAARGARCARPGLHHHHRAGRVHLGDAERDGRHGALPRALLQLVRHTNARATAPRVRLDRGLRQPRRASPGPACRAARSERGALPRAAASRRRSRHRPPRARGSRGRAGGARTARGAAPRSRSARRARAQPRPRREARRPGVVGRDAGAPGAARTRS